MKTYKLRKSLGIFRHTLKLYRKKNRDLNDKEREEVVHILNHLQEEILTKSRSRAHEYAQKAESLCQTHLKKTPFQRIKDFIIALFCALLVAVAIRTMWFEFYEIPTGSMRPTFSEQDRLVVSKTTFGINTPLIPGHFNFDPNLALRTGIMIFTGAGMDIQDVNTLYFYLFPGKKQYIKRLMGKPGDTLYFYGGKIYGIDKNGVDISKRLQPENLRTIDHVPYIHLNGKVILPSKPQGGIYAPITLKQMNQSVAKFTLSPMHKARGELIPPYNTQINDYFDLWGFKNYGMARLLTKSEVLEFMESSTIDLPDAPLYMEIVHHPTVRHPKIIRDHLGRLQPSVGTSSSLMPLQENHLKALFSNLYTARFIVKDGKASRYGSPIKANKSCRYCPDIPGIPDGTYEFYYGKAYQIFFSGIKKELPLSHPLYQFSKERIELLYNLGIEWVTYYAPMTKGQHLIPSRYVYYRDGDLYTMGGPFIKKEDPTLTRFIHKEYLKQENAASYRPHHPFHDYGSPIDENGNLKVELIKQYGLSIPKGHYLALGDNYAMSSDSRDFGLVPESNIRGAPEFIFWPPGKRMGPPPQADYPLINFPRGIVWGLALVCFGAWYLHYRKHHKLPVKIL